MKHLGSFPGKNLDNAILCYKFARKHDRPFSAWEVGIECHTLKKLAEKGIVIQVKKEKYKSPNRYRIASETIKVLERRYPEML
jgi:hypothetical protein